jgi:hypothetical protein
MRLVSSPLIPMSPGTFPGHNSTTSGSAANAGAAAARQTHKPQMAWRMCMTNSTSRDNAIHSSDEISKFDLAVWIDIFRDR